MSPAEQRQSTFCEIFDAVTCAGLFLMPTPEMQRNSVRFVPSRAVLRKSNLRSYNRLCERIEHGRGEVNHSQAIGKIPPHDQGDLLLS